MQSDFLSRIQDRALATDDVDLQTLLRAYERLDGITYSLTIQLASCEKCLDMATRSNRLVCAQRDEALAKLDSKNSRKSPTSQMDRLTKQTVGAA